MSSVTQRLDETTDDLGRLGAHAYLFAPEGRVAGYQVERQLGFGAMGAVFVAKLVGSEVRHALKVHLAEDSQSGDQGLRFVQEAQALATLRHPGIVRVHTFGLLPNGQRYFTMDLVEGRTLAELERTSLGTESVLRIGCRLAAALAYLHKRGIVHRDLKPDNVMLRAPDQTPVIVDFGVARVLGAARMTQTGQLLGTPLYMAPEQISGEKTVGPAADVFALGVVLYELLNGSPPFEGDSLIELAGAILRDEPAPLPKDVPADLGWLVTRCLCKSPAARPDAGWVADALTSLERGIPLRRKPWSSFRLGAALLLAGVGISVGLLTWKERALRGSASIKTKDRPAAPPTPTRDDVLVALRAGRSEDARRLVSVGITSARGPRKQRWQRLAGLVALFSGEFKRAHGLLPQREHGVIALERVRAELEAQLQEAKTGDPSVDAPGWAATLERLLHAGKVLKPWAEDERALALDRLVATIKFCLLQMPRGYFLSAKWEAVVAQGESLDSGRRKWTTYRALGRWFSARNPREEDRAKVREALALAGSRPESPLERSLELALQLLSAEEPSALVVPGLDEFGLAPEDCPFSAAKVFSSAHGRAAQHWRGRLHALLEAGAPGSEVAAVWGKAVFHARRSLRFGLREKGPGRVDGIRFQLAALLLLGGRKEEARHELSQFTNSSNWKTRLLRLELALLGGDIERAETELSGITRDEAAKSYADVHAVEAVVLSLQGRPEKEIRLRLEVADGLPVLLSWRSAGETRRELAGEGTRRPLVTWLSQADTHRAESQ